MVLMVRADVLDLTLPELGAAQERGQATAITLSVDRDGVVFVDGERVTLEGVPDRVRSMIDERDGATVLLAVDEDGRAGRLIEIADILIGAGITEFSVLGRPATPVAPEVPLEHGG